jgi:hypothetical protein
MFGESNTASSIGPNRRGLWVGILVGCLLLVTGAALVSGTVDGLNFFGGHLADSTPTFSDPPKDDEQRSSEQTAPTLSARSAPTSPTSSSTSPSFSVRSTATPPAPTVTAPKPAAVPPKPAAAAPLEKPICARPGYAALLEPAADPIGTALARSLRTSDLQTRIIELSDASGGNRESLAREDVDRIMAGDGSSVTGRIKEGTVVVARLKIQVRQTTIDQAQMTEVAGTMDLAIVRNNCGVITVDRHPDVPGRSVNETLEDGIRGLGEIFKEKIADLVRRNAGEREP